MLKIIFYDEKIKKILVAMKSFMFSFLISSSWYHFPFINFISTHTIILSFITTLCPFYPLQEEFWCSLQDIHLFIIHVISYQIMKFLLRIAIYFVSRCMQNHHASATYRKWWYLDTHVNHIMIILFYPR